MSRAACLSAALEAVDEGVAIWDAYRRLAFCNDRFRDAYPMLADLLALGADLRTVLSGAAAGGLLVTGERLDRWFDNRPSGKGGDQRVCEQRLDDGRRLLVGRRPTPEGGLVWTVSDVTEHRLAEETLALLTRAVEECPAIILIADPTGTIEYVNPKFSEVAGYAQQEVIGRSVAILKSSETPLADYRRMWATLGAGKPWRGRRRNRRKDGSEYLTEASISPVRATDGTITHFVGVEEDLTRRLEAEAQARAQRQQLNRYLRIATIGEMGAALAHELKQPIAAMVNYCRGSLRRLGAGSWTPEDLEDALGEALAEAERASEILHNVARFVRPSSQQKIPADVNGIIHSAVRFVDKDLIRHGIDFRLDLAADLPLVAVNAVEVEQTLLNLFRNAVDAVSEKPSGARAVVVRSVPFDAGAIKISVQDTGRGFPLDVAEHAFDPFFTTKPEGMGMGLAISRSIIEAHGGRVWVEANPGGGAGVHFTLPIREVHHAAA